VLPLRDRLPTRTTPVVNYLLIAANVLFFLGERVLVGSGYRASRLVLDWGLVPARFFHAPAQELVTVFTSMFMHDPTGWMHIGGNMLFLWIFGDNVEDALGHVRYLAFYIVCGLAAAFGQMLVAPDSLVPMVGASGAISGVLAAYVTLYPRSPILLLNPFLPLWFIFGLFFELPAWFVILEYFVVNLINGLSSLGTEGGGVAFFAHLAGFIGGLFLVRLFLIGRGPREHERWSGWRPPARRAPPPYGPRPNPRGPWEW